ncbi:fimbrial protein [Burkholderia sp. ABCPW 14]|uniref:fimbrial protein n=1 Tax=Burkholderia sp. ABCPW 14 TaxID=1637860 RepID=UPI000A670598|nr:fimbrial protein [Burkholderia sp. ABCPW 14]
MNQIYFSRSSVLTAVTVGLFAAQAHAADGMISFEGNIVGQTCSVVSAAQNVVLPTISVQALKDGVAAGNKLFSISVKGCDAKENGTIKAAFEVGPNVDIATGNLRNSGLESGAAKNVQISLHNKNDGSKITIGDASTIKSYKIDSGGSAKMDYIAKYVAVGSVGFGKVKSNVTFSLYYE